MRRSLDEKPGIAGLFLFGRTGLETVGYGDR
jgi:hypothetical protein